MKTRPTRATNKAAAITLSTDLSSAVDALQQPLSPMGTSPTASKPGSAVTSSKSTSTKAASATKATLSSGKAPSRRSKIQECSNCGTNNTPVWRRGSNKERLCNACGLYFKSHKTSRRQEAGKPTLNGANPDEPRFEHDERSASYEPHRTLRVATKAPPRLTQPPSIRPSSSWSSPVSSNEFPPTPSFVPEAFSQNGSFSSSASSPSNLSSSACGTPFKSHVPTAAPFSSEPEPQYSHHYHAHFHTHHDLTLDLGHPLPAHHMDGPGPWSSSANPMDYLHIPAPPHTASSITSSSTSLSTSYTLDSPQLSYPGSLAMTSQNSNGSFAMTSQNSNGSFTFAPPPMSSSEDNYPLFAYSPPSTGFADHANADIASAPATRVSFGDLSSSFLISSDEDSNPYSLSGSANTHRRHFSYEAQGLQSGFEHSTSFSSMTAPFLPVFDSRPSPSYHISGAPIRGSSMRIPSAPFASLAMTPSLSSSSSASTNSYEGEVPRGRITSRASNHQPMAIPTLPPDLFPAGSLPTQ